MGERLSYFLKDVFKSIWRNRMMALASLFVLVSCMLIMGTSVIISFNINAVAEKIENQNEIVIFLRDDITQAELTDLERSIERDSRITKSIYFSKEQALQEYIEQQDGDEYLYESLKEDNVLPASFRLSFDNSDGKISDSVSTFEKMAGVEKIRFNKDLVDKVDNFSKIINFVGIWLIIVLAIVSLFIIQNTIKIALFTRKKEINIMKYVGATDSFIQAPFVLEGVLIGIVSSAVAFGIQYILYQKVISGILDSFGIDLISAVPFSEMQLYILVPFALTGLIVGGIGSLMSIRKYLQV
ncbi:MAG: permease-like cell division protein FtsX [Clostridia bacterium]|nr:permease-like cell division protein FtsX [Clostridia bacterium]